MHLSNIYSLHNIVIFDNNKELSDLPGSSDVDSLSTFSFHSDSSSDASIDKEPEVADEVNSEADVVRLQYEFVFCF